MNAFHVTRVSQAPALMRVFITAVSFEFSLPPGESTIVNAEVAEALQADPSLQAHFRVTAVPEAAAPAPSSRRARETSAE